MQTASEVVAAAERAVADSLVAADGAKLATIAALHRSADAHERTAQRHEQAAQARWGDRQEHELLAAQHRTAAAADWQRADRHD
ncbi:MAG TPA: hypothetical protein VJT16_06220 [Streptosporangiaceae bacterium]|nr:hypothetical protein [Streptosporangiaceae bacterium]